MADLKIKILSKNTIVGKAKNITFCSSINCFIIVNDKGEYFISDSSMENIFGPISGTLSSTVSVNYLRFHDCLVISDNRKIVSRRDIGGTFLLKTALNEKFHGNIDDKAEVDIELTQLESANLLQYLLSPGIKRSTEKSRDVLAQLKKQLSEAKRRDKPSKSHKWFTVVLRGEFGFLQSMFSSIVSDLRQTNSRSPVLPVVAAIVERLNLLKDEPYSFELNAERSGYEKSSMASEAARRMTFARWPHMNYKWCLPDQMAEAGFFHQPNNGGDDRATCFMCNVCLKCWEPSNKPRSEHESHAPHCPFIKDQYTYNVPISVTYASTAAIDHGCGSDISVISTQSNCNWLATSTKCGEVVLWDVAKDLHKTDVVTLDPTDSFLEMETGYRHRAPKSAKVASADDSDNTTVFASGSPEADVADSLRDFIDMSVNEIANEIVAVCPQKGDIDVVSLCCVGNCNTEDETTQDETTQDYSDILVSPMTSSSTHMPSLIIGCGILEAKLNQQHQQFLYNQKNKNMSENCSPSSTTSSSPMSSFVQNLSTFNKSKLGEVIAPPGSAEESVAPPTNVASSSQTRTYRPFILVYKIEEVKDIKKRLVPIGSNGNEKSKYRTSNEDKASICSTAKSLSEVVFNLDGQSGGIPSSMNPQEKFTVPSVATTTTPSLLSADVDLSLFAASSAAGAPASSADVWPQSFGVMLTTNQMSSAAANALNIGNNNLNNAGQAMDNNNADAANNAINLPPSDDMLKIEYKKSNVNLVIMQCIRLPANLNDVSYNVDSIVPSIDGSYLFVVVNRHVTSIQNTVSDKVSSSQIFSAILTYSLTFNGNVVGLQEEPYRQCLYDHDVGLIKQLIVVPKDLILTNGQQPLHNGLDSLIVIVTEKGEIVVIDIESGQILGRMKASLHENRKFTAVTYVDADRLGVITDTGEVYVLELWSASEMEALSEEVLLQLFSHLNPVTKLICSGVSTTFYKVAISSLKTDEFINFDENRLQTPKMLTKPTRRHPVRRKFLDPLVYAKTLIKKCQNVKKIILKVALSTSGLLDECIYGWKQMTDLTLILVHKDENPLLKCLRTLELLPSLEYFDFSVVASSKSDGGEPTLVILGESDLIHHYYRIQPTMLLKKFSLSIPRYSVTGDFASQLFAYFPKTVTDFVIACKIYLRDVAEARRLDEAVKFFIIDHLDLRTLILDLHGSSPMKLSISVEDFHEKCPNLHTYGFNKNVTYNGNSLALLQNLRTLQITDRENVFGRYFSDLIETSAPILTTLSLNVQVFAQIMTIFRVQLLAVKNLHIYDDDNYVEYRLNTWYKRSQEFFDTLPNLTSVSLPSHLFVYNFLENSMSHRRMITEIRCSDTLDNWTVQWKIVIHCLANLNEHLKKIRKQVAGNPVQVRMKMWAPWFIEALRQMEDYKIVHFVLVNDVK